MKPYEFAQTGKYSIDGYHSAEQAQSRRDDVFQGLNAAEMENSLNEFAALINSNPLEWHEWDFTASSNNL